MKKWEFCWLSISGSGQVALRYYGPDDSREVQLGTHRLGQDRQKSFDEFVVRLLNEGWEPFGDPSETLVKFKRIRPGT